MNAQNTGVPDGISLDQVTRIEFHVSPLQCKRLPSRRDLLRIENHAPCAKGKMVGECTDS